MNDMLNLVFPLVILGFILLVGAIILIIIIRPKKGDNKDARAADRDDLATGKGVKRNPDTGIKKEDVLQFMEFDRILDDMIVQNGGRKYTMMIKCKGINYDLMSEIEQLAVEEGFITFLNTIRYPIQLYVQAQNIDLKKSVRIYNERLENIKIQYEQINDEYNVALNSLDTTEEELHKIEANKKSIQNVLEYATDIVRYVEKLSVNKNLLQRNFYIVYSYYTSEITSISNFNSEEILNIVYNELYTRGQSILGLLMSCGVSGRILDSNQIAELLYSSYNRDDKNYISIQQALESGFHRLYSTSKDALIKKNEMLDETIALEAKEKAIEALQKAIERGEVVTPSEFKQNYAQEVSKKAIDMVKERDFSDDVKKEAKKILIEDYRKEKQRILDEEKAQVELEQKRLAEERKHVNTFDNVHFNGIDDIDNNINNNNDDKKLNENNNPADDSIV